MDSETIVDVRALNHWFGSGDVRKQALFDVNLTLKRGSFTVLMGPSGSGKTTVLTLVGCLRAVQDGSVRLLESELKGASQSRLVSLRRRLGFIFQAHKPPKHTQHMQNVMMGVQVHGEVADSVAQSAAEHALGLVGLADRTTYLPAYLSGGQKQRVAVARALCWVCLVVLADEPTAALDKDSAADVVDLLKRMGEARGTTTLLVTHDNRILDRADRILTLEDGRIVKTEERAQNTHKMRPELSHPAS